MEIDEKFNIKEILEFKSKEIIWNNFFCGNIFKIIFLCVILLLMLIVGVIVFVLGFVYG